MQPQSYQNNAVILPRFQVIERYSCVCSQGYECNYHGKFLTDVVNSCPQHPQTLDESHLNICTRVTTKRTKKIFIFGIIALS